MVAEKLAGCDPPPEILRSSDLVLRDTGDIVDRVLKSVRDVCKPRTAIADPIHDGSDTPQI